MTRIRAREAGCASTCSRRGGGVLSRKSRCKAPMAPGRASTTCAPFTQTAAFIFGAVFLSGCLRRSLLTRSLFHRQDCAPHTRMSLALTISLHPFGHHPQRLGVPSSYRHLQCCPSLDSNVGTAESVFAFRRSSGQSGSRHLRPAATSTSRSSPTREPPWWPTMSTAAARQVTGPHQQLCSNKLQVNGCFPQSKHLISGPHPRTVCSRNFGLYVIKPCPCQSVPVYPPV